MQHKARLSHVTEDYLKAIYHLQRADGDTTAREVAVEMEVSPSSVTGMLRKLSSLGLIHYAPYRHISLTEAGELAALEVIRHHRLLELYLQKKLGYSLAGVHEEAEQLEHTISEELEEKISAVLGNPQVDPHGSPIPARNGSMTERDLIPLDQVKTGIRVTVRQLLSRGPDQLRYLEAMGLLPGVLLEVVERRPLGEPLSLRIGRDRVEVIGQDLARLILVHPSEPGGKRELPAWNDKEKPR